MRLKNILISILLSGFFYHNLNTMAEELSMPGIFTDHMVLQRNQPVQVWGQATPGDHITVQFAGQNSTCVTNKKGQWKLKLKPMNACSVPGVLTVSGNSGQKKIKDVVVGDVWLCSGQSNMNWMLIRSQNGREALKKADYPNIRIFAVKERKSGIPSQYLPEKWLPCTPNTVKYFSAVAFYFGRELHKELNVPVGLIKSAWNGTRIEPWTPACGFENDPKLTKIKKQIADANANYQKDLKSRLPNIAKWLQRAENADKSNRPIELPADLLPPHPLDERYFPTGIYNAMINPIVHYAIRGIIWHQGESNVIACDGMLYANKMKALINGWRKVWELPELPFYFVQIAPYTNYKPGELPKLWEAQYAVADEVKNCNLVSIVDIANIKNIHPLSKEPVGKRLAFLALSETCGKKIPGGKCPRFAGMRQKGETLIINFTDLDDNLKTSDGKPAGEFMTAEKNGNFYPAQAEIKGREIILRSDKVKKPFAVKYSWHKTAQPNLMSGSGLPVMPFKASLQEK
ncbi:MAG: sialate O-acetylesterase [Victivallaceae bacterium]